MTNPRDADYMEIIPKILEYTGPRDLSQYFIKEYTAMRVLITDMGMKKKL